MIGGIGKVSCFLIGCALWFSAPAFFFFFFFFFFADTEEKLRIDELNLCSPDITHYKDDKKQTGICKPIKKRPKFKKSNYTSSLKIS